MLRKKWKIKKQNKKCWELEEREKKPWKNVGRRKVKKRSQNRLRNSRKRRRKKKRWQGKIKNEMVQTLQVSAEEEMKIRRGQKIDKRMKYLILATENGILNH